MALDLSLLNRFNIIEDHLSNESETKIINKIKNYIENFLLSDIHIFPPEYINQSLWFNKIDKNKIVNDINQQIKNSLVQHRNNIRTFIKKEKFSLQSLNIFLGKIISKLKYINMITCSNNFAIMSECIMQLSNLIISDSLIVIFIEDQFINFNQQTKTSIKLFLNIVQLGKIYDQGEIFTKILKIMSNVFVKHIKNNEEYPLPENLKRLQKISDDINFCAKINSHYNFIKNEFKIYGTPIIDIITHDLCLIIQLNAIDEIYFTLKTINVHLKSFYGKIDYHDKIKFHSLIIEATIRLLDNFIHSAQQSYILELVDIIKYLDDIIINKNYIIEQKMRKIFNCEKILEQIHIYINDFIIKNDKENVNKILNYVSSIKEKDIFVNNYYQNLVKRLMTKIIDKKFYVNYESRNNFQAYINTEYEYAELIKYRFGAKLYYKLKKVIDDITVSYENNYHFIVTKLLINTNNLDKSKLKVIITSYDNWDINQTDGIITDEILDQNNNSQLCKYLKLYSSNYYNYRNCYNTKVLKWFLHFGEVSITYNEKNLLLLPIQFMVVEMFENVNSIPIKEILNASFFANYTHKFRSDIINSLIISKLFELNGLNIELSKTSNFNTDLIEIFFTNSDYVNLWEEQHNNDLIHTRKEITSCVINTILKKSNNGLDTNELFKETKANINIFELSQEIFDDTIKHMSDCDYINFDINSHKYVKLYY
jgi:hypothetical protein